MPPWMAAAPLNALAASKGVAPLLPAPLENLIVVAIVMLLGVSALLTLGRIMRGPSALDRAIGAEALVAILLCLLGAEAVVFRHTTTIPLLISLSMLGFLGSVAVARFLPHDVDPDRGGPMPTIPHTDEVPEVDIFSTSDAVVRPDTAVRPDTVVRPGRAMPGAPVDGSADAGDERL